MPFAKPHIRIWSIFLGWLVLAITFGSSLLGAARADWINLTGAETSPNIAEITVLDDRVNVRLEIFVGDLKSFADVVPDDLLKAGGEGRPGEAERLHRFSREVFSIKAPNGTPLSAVLKLAEPRQRIDRKSPFAGMINPQTRRRVPEAPADKRVLYVELDYLFDGAPSSLMISPPLDDNGNATVAIGFIAYHKAVPVIDFRYLSGAARLDLDWDDPWYTRFESQNLKRHHKNALMSFLYVEPREVRHELLFRVRDLEDWTDLGLVSRETIDGAHKAGVKERALAFLTDRNLLSIDGTQSRPTSSQAEFLNLALTGVQVVEDDQPIELTTAILGVILSYQVDRLPQNVSIEWDLFNERIGRIPTNAIDPAGPLPSFVDADNPTIKWQNFLLKYSEPKVTPVDVDAGQTVNIPLISLGLFILGLTVAGVALRFPLAGRRRWIGAGMVLWVGAILLMRTGILEARSPFAGTPDEAAAARIITDVLDNVHAAYLERDRSRLERALGVVVARDALDDIEPELSRALAIKVAGGGIARVSAIEELAVQDIATLDDQYGFRSVAEWTALASAGHWGHSHRQRIRFRALMEVAELDGTWRLVGLTIVDTRIES